MPSLPARPRTCACLRTVSGGAVVCWPCSSDLDHAEVGERSGIALLVGEQCLYDGVGDRLGAEVGRFALGMYQLAVVVLEGNDRERWISPRRADIHLLAPALCIARFYHHQDEESAPHFRPLVPPTRPSAHPPDLADPLLAQVLGARLPALRAERRRRRF